MCDSCTRRTVTFSRRGWGIELSSVMWCLTANRDSETINLKKCCRYRNKDVCQSKLRSFIVTHKMQSLSRATAHESERASHWGGASHRVHECPRTVLDEPALGDMERMTAAAGACGDLGQPVSRGAE